MFYVAADGSLSPVNLGASLSMNLPAAGYDPTNPFQVNTLSIMAYNDGFTTAGRSLACR